MQIDADFLGLDVYPKALEFAVKTGLITDAICIDLETEALAEPQRQRLSDVDLIISTTALDFATETTFNKIYDAIAPAAPWCAIFALRMHALDPLRALSANRGLWLETLDALTFVQRRFASTQEWTQMLMALEEQGVATRGKEADGLLHANFHLLRPAASEHTHVPLSELVSVSKGNDRRFGNWRRRPWGV